MDELFATCAKPGKFQWERDARDEALADLVGKNTDYNQDQNQNISDDPFLMNDFTNPETVSSSWLTHAELS